MKSSLLTHSKNSIFLAVLALAGTWLAGGAALAASTWTPTTSGTWTVSTNWSPTGVPNGAGVTANLTSALTANSAVTLGNTNITVGTLNIGTTAGTFAYTLSTGGASGTLTMNNSGAGALIAETGLGADIISAPIVIADTNSTASLTITNASTTKAFTISGPITSSGSGENLVLEANGASGTAGVITISGLINNQGTISNSGTGTAQINLSGGIGSNVTSLISASTTSNTYLSSNVTMNGTFTFTVNTGSKGINITTSSISGSGDLIFNGNGSNAIGSTGFSNTFNNTGMLYNTGSGSTNTTRLDQIVGPNVTGVVENSGTSKLELDGVNTYTSNTSILAGTLIIGGSNSTGVLGSGSYAGAILDNGTFQYSSWASGGQILSGNIAGTGGLTVSGTTSPTVTTLTLSGSNSYSGATTISAGVLSLTTNNAMGNTSGVTVANNSALQLTNSITTSGTPSLNLKGSGPTGNGALESVSGANAYSGLITLGGTATIGVDSGSTLNISNTGTITGSGLALTLTGSGTGIIASTISNGTGGINKNGSGTWTLSNRITTTGTTSINAGTLVISVGGATYTGDVQVGNGTAVATLAGSGTINGNLYTTSTGSYIAHIAPGGAGTAGTLTISGFPIFGAGTNFDYDLASATTVGGGVNDLLNGGGGLITFSGTETFNFNALGTLATGTAYTLINNASYSGFSAANFSATGIGTDTAVFTQTGTGVFVTFTGGATPATAAYFNGQGGGSLNTAGDFDSDASSSTPNTSNVTGTTNVFFSANRNTLTSATNSSSLTVNSLNFGVGSGTNSGITVSGSSPITIEATSANGNTAGSGITLVGSGTDTISAPITLGGNQTWSIGTVGTGGKLTVSGAVTGGYALTKSGTGTLALSSNSNTYSGGTTVSSGTLVVTNTSGSATGSGAFSLSSGAFLTGTGTITSTGNNTINGTVTPGTGATDVASVLTMTASGTTNFTGASLSFNLNGASPGHSTSINVGSTGTVYFGAGTVLTLNLIDTTTTIDPALYTIFTTTASGSGSLASQSVFGGATFTWNTTTGVISGLSFNIVNSSAPAGFYNRSYLEFVSNGNGAFNIDVEVVPEPGTWALMLGGLVLLVLVQSRRRKNGQI